MSAGLIKRLGTVIVGLAVFVGLWHVPVLAAPPADGAIGRATFRGELIDLRYGWRGAQSCEVLAQTDTRCFVSRDEADAAMARWMADRSPANGGQLPETASPVGGSADPPVAQGVAGTTALPSCGSGWLCLYEHIDGGGRRLSFRDEYWQYLSAWGFDRQTSSWRNNQGSSDAGHLSLYNSPSVYNCWAGGYVANLGFYNDQAYAVWG